MSQVICQADSKLAAESLVQQGFFQGGQLALVEGGEALGFGLKRVQVIDYPFLLPQWRKGNLALAIIERKAGGANPGDGASVSE
ncbi:MAG: hypothetical protein Q8O79_07395 [Pseudomonadota bacterium]|nr:hypothetical protein [Pseudomonadota bacterium]